MLSDCKKERSAQQLLFDSYAFRTEKLPIHIQSLLQLQLSQLFFNAENPNMPQVPITPLVQQPAATTYMMGESSASGMTGDIIANAMNIANYMS